MILPPLVFPNLPISLHALALTKRPNNINLYEAFPTDPILHLKIVSWSPTGTCWSLPSGRKIVATFSKVGNSLSILWASCSSSPTPPSTSSSTSLSTLSSRKQSSDWSVAKIISQVCQHWTKNRKIQALCLALTRDGLGWIPKTKMRKVLRIKFYIFSFNFQNIFFGFVHYNKINL